MIEVVAKAMVAITLQYMCIKSLYDTICRFDTLIFCNVINLHNVICQLYLNKAGKKVVTVNLTKNMHPESYRCS